MCNLQILIDTHNRLSHKPEKSKAGKAMIACITNMLNQAIENPTFYTPPQIAHLVGNLGCTFMKDMCNGKKGKAGVIYTYAIVLDFDKCNENGYYYPQEEAILIELGLTPTFVYKTLSCSDEKLDKFRIVFLLSEPIYDYKEVLKIYRAFTKIFKGRFDETSDEPSRMFYGGKGLIEYDFQPIHRDNIQVIDTFELIAKLNPFLYDIDSNSGNCTKKCIDSGLISESVENVRFTGKPIYNIIDYPAKRTKMNDISEEFNRFSSRQPYNENKIYEHIDIDTLMRASTLNIVQDFLTTHFQWKNLSLLIMNMMWIKGGVSWVERVMIENNKAGISRYGEKSNDFELLRTLPKERRYGNMLWPADLDKFKAPYSDPDRYNDDYKKFKNLVDYLTNKHRGSKKGESEKPPFYTLEEFDKKLLDIFVQMLKVKEKYVIIKLPPGSGKTTWLLKQMRVIIAFINHSLKQEFKDKYEYINACVPDPKGFKDSEINKFIDMVGTAFVSEDKHKKYEEVLLNKYGNYSQEDIDNVIRIQTESAGVEDYEEWRESLLATHSYLLQKGGEYSVNIFWDEDIMDSVIQRGFIEGDEFFNCLDTANSPIKDEWAKFVGWVSTLGNDTYNKIPKEFNSIDIKELKKCARNANYPKGVIGLPNADWIYVSYDSENKKKGLSWVKKLELPDAPKHIFMSATIDPDMYKILYGAENVHVFDLSNVEHKGKVVQINMPVSRNKIETWIDAYDYSADNEKFKKLDEKQRIKLEKLKPFVVKLFNLLNDCFDVGLTYKGYTNRLDKYGVCNISKTCFYGKETGTNEHEGKTSFVLGAQTLAETDMGLVYCALYNEAPKKEAFDMGFVSVDKYGIKRDVYTYKNERISKIHLQRKEGSSIQIIGRTRCLRNESGFCVAFTDVHLPFEVEYIESTSIESIEKICMIANENRKINYITKETSPDMVECIQQIAQATIYNDDLGDNPF